MACFLVSTAEAIVVTAAAKAVKNNEMKADSQKLAKIADEIRGGGGANAK